MKNFFPENISPKLYSLSAVAVGYLLIDDLDAIEQNALGNWLMLAAQVVCTNAYFKQLQSARQSEKELSDEDTIKMLKKLKDTLEVELEKLSK